MTTEQLNELDRLSNPQLAQEEADKRSRSSFRPPFNKATVDIVGIEGPYTPTLNNGQPANGTAVALRLENMHAVEGDIPFTGTTYDLEVRLPANPNLNSEVTLMVASAQGLKPEVVGVTKLVGLKGVRLEERVHHYTGNIFQPSVTGTKTDRTGAKGEWVEGQLTTRYYHVVSIGGASSNGATPAVTPERLVEAEAAIAGLSHADALVALGADGPAVLSKLVLAKRIHQEAGVYVVAS